MNAHFLKLYLLYIFKFSDK